MKKNGLVIIVMILSGIIISNSIKTAPAFSVVYTENKEMSETAAALEKELNKNALRLTDKYDIYVANFDTSDIPDIVDKTHKTILYMGGRKGFDLNQVKAFDYVFVSTPDLKEFLKIYDIKSELVPQFLSEYSKKSSKCVENPRKEKCYYVVIGNNTDDVQMMQKLNIPIKHYKKTHRAQINDILADAENIAGLILYDTKMSELTLDYSPIILKAMSAKIPVITDDRGLQYFTQNIITSYDIPYILQEQDFIPTVKRAYNFLKLMSPQAAAQRILSCVTENKDYLMLDNAIAINGNTRAVDTFMNRDLQEGLERNNIDNVQIYHLDSYVTDIAKVDIYMRGVFSAEKDYPKAENVLSVFYLYYPLVHEWYTYRTDMETYLKGMLPELNKFDIVAVASKEMAQKLSEYNIKAYYVPQYTNPRRFHPEYHKELATDVLFIGTYATYRRTVLACLKNNIPVSIYGPKWPDNLASGEYISNDELYKYYSSAKIILSDQRGEMTNYGFISNRIFDATASGGFVISEYIPAVEEVYGDSIPMWKTEEELIELVNYYLNPAHEAERRQKIETARRITLENYTAEKIGEKFKQIILENHQNI